MAGLQKQNIHWAVSLFLMILYFSSLTAQAQYGGGSGTAKDPYLIYTAEQMNAIGADANDWDKNFKLMSDIDLSKYTAEEFNIIGERYYESGWIERPFTGVFDGNGHIISNFSYISKFSNRIVLFGYIEGENALIKDLGLIDPNIALNVTPETGNHVGSLVGENRGTITNCYVEGGSVSGNDDVGRLVGENSWEGTITNCYSSGNVSGVNDVGGLVGENHNTITNCYSKGDVLASGNAFKPGGGGGLVGTNYATIINCTSSTSVSGNDYTGGLVARNYGTITNCYAASSVSGSGTELWFSGVGGLVGYNYYGTITNCYSVGGVVGTKNVGGLVGEHSWGGTISYCYSSGDVSGNDSVGGLVGTNSNTITNCYATGSVLASGTEWWPGIGGGLVGENSWGGTISNCYSAGSVIVTAEVGGLVGENRGEVVDSFWDTQTSGQATSDAGTSKTTAELQVASTFTEAGWDFVGESVNGTEDIWSICEETNYPRLGLQIPAGDFVCPDGITIEDFVFFIEHWGDYNCDPNNDYCQGTDLDFSGTVDAGDLEILLENWPQSQPILPPQPPVPPPPPGPPAPPPKGRGCFLADTPVWVNGALVQISKVVPGQMVGELHRDLAIPCLERVEKVEEHEGTFECRDIVLESGNHISVVDAHCFMLDSGQWIAAQDLRSGLRLKTIGGTVGIKSAATRASPFVGKVYNLKITGADRYLVG
ncbi:MAG: GLUG motif-containing protein, partial [Planctomycetota bacterium]